MKCPIIPLSDKVIILPKDEGEQQYGSIIVPDMGKEKPEMGEVLAVGEGRVTNQFSLTFLSSSSHISIFLIHLKFYLDYIH